ncbi:hypothetical protein D3C84_868220 [compost metagenome]
MFGQQGITVFTAIDQRLRAVDIAQMTVTALTADQRGDGSELAVAGNVIGRTHVKFGAHYAVHTTLVINQTARAEL